MAWRVAYDEGRTRSYLRSKVLAVALTLGALGIGLPTLALNAGLSWWFDQIRLGTLGRLAGESLRVVIFGVVIASSLACLYRYAPRRARAKWRWLAPSAIIATIAMGAGSTAFSYYVRHWGSYSQTYSTFTGVFVLMLWLYLSAFFVLLGAEINAELEAQTTVDTTTGPARVQGQRGAKKADMVGAAYTKEN